MNSGNSGFGANFISQIGRPASFEGAPYLATPAVYPGCHSPGITLLGSCRCPGCTRGRGVVSVVLELDCFCCHFGGLAYELVLWPPAAASTVACG